MRRWISPRKPPSLAEIGKFLMNGSLYRGLRPVMWSPVEKTALAEAEIEYHDHVSPTLHAKFRILKAGAADLVGADVVILDHDTLDHAGQSRGGLWR
jgi:isoleucyl-tRNA synthetase